MSFCSYVVCRDAATGRWYYYGSTFPVSSYPVGSLTETATSSESLARDMVFDLNS